jgi:predicted ATPase
MLAIGPILQNHHSAFGRAEAHDVLGPVYRRFTEGFDTPDLQEAKTLLEALDV